MGFFRNISHPKFGFDATFVIFSKKNRDLGSKTIFFLKKLEFDANFHAFFRKNSKLWKKRFENEKKHYCSKSRMMLKKQDVF